MYVHKLPPAFRAELFVRTGSQALPVDGTAAQAETEFRKLLELSRGIASSAKYSNFPHAVVARTNGFDPMDVGAAHTDAKPAVAASRVTGPPETREQWLRKRGLCIRCGLPPTDDPPTAVCAKHWKGRMPMSGKAGQC